jgi:hypothetical protein
MPSTKLEPTSLLTGLAPVIAPDTRILILGSFPGAQSLAAQQYYAHPRNQFWKLVGELVGEDLYSCPYDERLPRLLAHRFGLWDVLAACEREGQPRFRDPQAGRQRFRPPAPPVPGAGDGRLQRPGLRQVRAAVRTGRLSHRGAAVVSRRRIWR